VTDPTPESIVIVGASLAGAKAAETLRAEGYEGRLVLVGDEPERPYERPPLSKDYLRDSSGREKVFVHPEGFYEEQGIDLRTGTVSAIDPGLRTATLADGDQLEWDRLLLCVGAEPRRPPIPGIELDGVMTLRSLPDSDRLREVIASGGPLAVVGAGWIGCEVAASARQMGAEVTLIERDSLPLLAVLGEEVGGFYADVHREHGVQLLTDAAVEAFEGPGRVERVRLAGGRTIDCAAALVGVGVAPRTGLAAGAGLAIGDGVLVDAHLRTSAPGIFAAGDAASAQHPFYGRRVRVEHWANALNQGPCAARNMLGKGEPYERLPYFFSDQYEVGMEYTGLVDGDSRVVMRGDPSSRELMVFWLDGDSRVLAGMNINVWDVTESVQALIRARRPVDEVRLADPGVPLEELLPDPA
jgi:3-phenylpropionate/trans-cinnamate dioxygenase ferredoxin reductase subunit